MPEWIFYDGHCGLCHRMVRFAVTRDRDGSRFRFAPLYGATFQAQVPANEWPSLPDSIVLLTEDGRLLERSAAVRHVLRRLGRTWRLMGGILGLFPRAAADRAYDFVARIRHRLFKRPADVCPVLPEDLRKRFAP